MSSQTAFIIGMAFGGAVFFMLGLAIATAGKDQPAAVHCECKEAWDAGPDLHEPTPAGIERARQLVHYREQLDAWGSQ